MKPLTIEELKALEVGDWVWITNENGCLGCYVAKASAPYEEDNKTFSFDSLAFSHTYSYSDYGTKWIAYKNKEQAEAKEERFTRKESTYYEKAIARLQELENERESKVKIVQLPCLIEIPFKLPCIDTVIEHKNYHLLYINQDGMLITDVFAECDKAKAEARLQEQRGEK